MPDAAQFALVFGVFGAGFTAGVVVSWLRRIRDVA